MENIIQIASGYNYCLFLSSNGIVYGIGNNKDHQLGLEEKYYTTPTIIPLSNKIIQIACGESHSMFLTADGYVYGCGCNSSGRLGLDGSYINIPTLIQSVHNIVQIVCANKHSLFLTKYGQVYGCGHNREYVLGLPKCRVSIPTLVSTIDNIVYIASCSKYTFYLTYDGRIYVSSKTIESKDPKLIVMPYRIIDIVCNEWCKYILTQNGTVYALSLYGSDNILVTRIRLPYRVIQIASGFNNLLCLSTDSKVYNEQNIVILHNIRSIVCSHSAYIFIGHDNKTYYSNRLCKEYKSSVPVLIE